VAQNDLPDPVSRTILAELKDLRVEMRGMRVDMREMAVEMRADRQRSDEERRRSDEERRRSDERFRQMMHEFRTDSARREAATQKAFKDVRTVGLAILRILERMDRKLGARGDGLPGPDNGR
jgi:Skp family chaperone for outer membrane proteins